MPHPIRHPTGSPPPPTALERQALDWLARADAGMTAAQELEFERWLASNPRHAEAFAEFDGTWHLLNRLRESPGVGAFPSGAIDANASSGCRRFRVRPWVLATAAAIVVAGVSWWRMTPPRAAENLEYSLVAASAVGVMRTLPLPDGSTIRLNTDSAVEVRYSSAERRIRLSRGEAHFTVAKIPARPFIVNAAKVGVRAIGTAFNVRVRAEAVEVVVTSGQVEVNDDKGHSLLSLSPSAARASDPAAPSNPAATLDGPMRPLVAGEKITIPLAPDAIAIPSPAPPIALPAVEIARTLAWQQCRLEFDSVPLREMVAEFNRYNREKLVIGDSPLAGERFGGTFRADDPAGFVRMLEVNFDVQVERRANEIVLRSAR